MRIHSLEHVEFEDLASIKKWIASRGHTLTTTRFFNNDPLPDPGDVDWLIVMGGSMGAYEEEKFPWLVSEKQFIRKVISRSRTVLGICLGSQILASALGGRVFPCPEKEIGWHTVRRAKAPDVMNPLRDFPAEFPAFLWHGDTFDVPEGAILLASSDACPNQAYAFDEKVLGLQFHLEVEPENVERLVRHCGGDLRPGMFVQTADEILSQKDFYPVIGKLMDTVLGYLENHTD